MTDDKRLIEDYLPIEAISAEASREKSVRDGHISTLHLWWARRPLVACRAAVYGALVPASRFVPNGGSDEKKKSLGRANSARFVKDLCKYPGGPRAIEEAQRHILIAHADRLTQELAAWKADRTTKPGWVEEFKFPGATVTMEDVIAGRAPRPRVLDMFAGGGAIPLEALRLGCEAYALDLNPVAHIIQLCTLVYPQKYGKPDTSVRGMTGPKNEKGETTWGGLAEEVRYWANWVLNKVKAEVGDLYPPVPDPQSTTKKKPAVQTDWFKEHDPGVVPAGYLIPVAYIWTRIVKCKNPTCRANVPLLRQTWLCKKKDRYVALKVVAPKDKKQVRFEVVESKSEAGLGFDPEAGSKAGNATCPFCGTVADSDYVKAESTAGRLQTQMTASVCMREGHKGKVYLSADNVPACVPNDDAIRERIRNLCEERDISPVDDRIEANPRSFDTQHFGITTWAQLFTPRQMLSLLSFADAVRELTRSDAIPSPSGHKSAVVTLSALMMSRMVNFSSTLCLWNYTGGRGVVHSFSRQSLPMTWDFPESNPFYSEAAGWQASIDSMIAVLSQLPQGPAAKVVRGSAQSPPFEELTFDAIVTDPPYYDNVSYSNLSDFFYVWLKRMLRFEHPEHLTSELTPKKAEIIAAFYRHGDDRGKARTFYESGMTEAFIRAFQLLKSHGSMTIVYAHKTTLGWATLIDSLRKARFEVTEAWPLATERPGGMKVDKAMLASSIFLVARKRDPSSKTGNYETNVVPELGSIVRERVNTLWEMGISGADLVIACVGAGLRAFTKYGSVEYANGEEVPAERFLAEVETVVLETILGKLSETVGSKKGQTSLAGLDPATRFYVLWRYTYGAAELDAGEAIIFANGTHVELDGQHGLTQGKGALLEKKKSKYRLHDFTERGKENALGQLAEDGTAAPAVDTLHRLLWLLEHKPLKIPEFLDEAKPNVEQLRLIAQAIGGPALSGGELSDVSSTSEQTALGKLLANWNAVMVGKAMVEDRRTGQDRLFAK
jgi:putative DNA methylase